MNRPKKPTAAPSTAKPPDAGHAPAAPAGSSVASDRAWAQNRIGNFFKAQQAAKSKTGAEQANALHGQSGADHADPQHPGGHASPGAPSTLEAACMADTGIAKQKWHDVAAEKQPRAVAMRPSFVAGATERLHAGKTPLMAMRNEVSESGQKYMCLGNPVPEQIIAGSSGVSRILDLPSLFDRGYLKGSFIAAHALATSSDFLECVRQGKFDPSRDMNEANQLKGKAEETWWFPSTAANAANLEKLREQLYIHQDINYSHGAVRLDMPPAELKAHNIELHKPTAFDGMMQGWEGDAWWKHSEDPHWGLTKNNTYEAVMRMTTLEHFKHRTLIMPTAVAPAAHSGAASAAGGPLTPTGNKRG